MTQVEHARTVSVVTEGFTTGERLSRASKAGWKEGRENSMSMISEVFGEVETYLLLLEVLG